MQVNSPGYQTHTKRFHQWQICLMMKSTLNQEKITRLVLRQTHSQFPVTGLSVSKKQMLYLLLEYSHLMGHLELVQSQTTEHKQPCILHVTGSFKLNYNIDIFKQTAWNQDYSTSLRDWSPLLLQYGWRATSYKGVIFEVLNRGNAENSNFRRCDAVSLSAMCLHRQSEALQELWTTWFWRWRHWDPLKWQHTHFISWHGITLHKT
jgi:hypothetical protein